MQKKTFLLETVHISWRPAIEHALTFLDTAYLEKLYYTHNWLPGHHQIFNAFSLPLSEVNYVLLGESPYPRAHSANGYAFWDAHVKNIWSPTGLSKEVNRATSLRNIIKMLLVAEGVLSVNHTSQSAIQQLDKSSFVQTNAELFQHFLNKGFLLLNTTLVLSRDLSVRQDAIAWQPFIQSILQFLLQHRPHTLFVLLGKVAETVDRLINLNSVRKLFAEHPYNLSFIKNPTVLEFFHPLHLLLKS